MQLFPAHGADVASERAGTFQRQLAGYRAFIPARLPPQPPVRISGAMQRLLSEADVALGRLDGSILILPNPDFFRHDVRP